MTVRHVSVPATPELSWVVPRRELCPGETRPASPDDARRAPAGFAPGDCDGCSQFVERAMRAIALALDDDSDEWPPFEGPTD
jgi:hypothetical protein